MRGSDLLPLVLSCLQNGNRVSRHRRKPFMGRVPEGVFDFIEQCAQDSLAVDGVAEEAGPGGYGS